MDPTLTGALVGALVGGLFSLVPGLHVNTLAALTLVTLPALPGWAGPGPAPAGATAFLLAALGAATVVNVLPLVLLGVPEGSDAPALLPGQRMARQGQAGEALSASATGSLIGLTLAAVVAVPLVEPLAQAHGTGLLAQLTPWVAAGALAFLVASDPAGPLRATLVVGLAGWLGLLALGLPVASPVGLPASVLLPLFLGLFGVPALRLAARAGPPVAAPRDSAGGKRSGHAGGDTRDEGTGLAGPVLGASLGLLAGIFPGFTAGPATAVAATLRRVGDKALMATTAAVNTAAAVMASVALHAYGRTRTGVHAAQMALGAPLGGLDVLVGDLQALTLGVAVGTVFLAALCRSAPVIGRAVPKVATVLVPLWMGMVWAFTGWVGLLVTVAGWAVARVAAREGARRSLLMAALLVPTVIRAVGA